MPRRTLDLALGGQSLRDHALEFVGLPIVLFVLLGIVGYEGGRALLQALAPVAPLPAAAREAPACAFTTVEALAAINLAPTRSFVFDGATYGLHRGQAECTIRGAKDPFSRTGVKDRSPSANSPTPAP